MVKVLAFVLVLAIVSAAPLQGSFDGAKNFILGYFTGFQESTYNLTESCLPDEFQTQMMQDWDDILETGNLEKILAAAFKFERDLEQMAGDCMLWVLPVSIIYSLENKGLDTFRDFVEHFGSIALDLAYAVERIDDDAFESGRSFGTALGYFLAKVPVNSEKRHLRSVQGHGPNFLDGFTNFTNGLIHGLQLNNTGTSQCLTSFQTIKTSVNSMGSVFFHCLLLDMDACNQLGISLENALMVIVAFSTNCNFSKLFSDFGSLLTITGWVTLYKNMYWYQTQIRAAYSLLLAAYLKSDYFNTGVNLGDILQLAFSFTVK